MSQAMRDIERMTCDGAAISLKQLIKLIKNASVQVEKVVEHHF